MTPDAVAISIRETATSFIDAFDYKRLPKGITQASVSKLISDATFAATFFRRYGLVLDASTDDASAVVSAADALDIENLGLALIHQDSQDNLGVLRAPKGAPVPNRREMALLAVGLPPQSEQIFAVGVHFSMHTIVASDAHWAPNGSVQSEIAAWDFKAWALCHIGVMKL